MAETDQIAQLRLLIAEAVDELPYTNAVLSARLDAESGEINTVAHSIWTEKAATYASLVDISEGGSSRKNGDLYEQALSMAAHFGGLIPGGEPVGRAVRIRRIRR